MLAVDPNLLAKSPIVQSPGSAKASSWICCQIGGREHYAVPRALHRHGALGQMITDAWLRPGNPLGLLSAGLKARFHAELAGAEVYGPAVRSMAFELRARRSVQAGWPLVMARNRWFQRVALARLSQVVAGERAPILMSYSYAAAELFAFARRKGWRTVLGQIDPGPVEEEIVGGLHAAAPRAGSEWTRAPSAYWSAWKRECALADRIVVNSSWSRAALLQEGVPADKIRIVPLAYERPPESMAFRRRYPSSFSSTRPLRVLFLGQVNLRKGVAEHRRKDSALARAVVGSALRRSLRSKDLRERIERLTQSVDALVTRLLRRLPRGLTRRRPIEARREMRAPLLRNACALLPLTSDTS